MPVSFVPAWMLVVLASMPLEPAGGSQAGDPPAVVSAVPDRGPRGGILVPLRSRSDVRCELTLGDDRRLVLDFAADEAGDAPLERPRVENVRVELVVRGRPVVVEVEPADEGRVFRSRRPIPAPTAKVEDLAGRLFAEVDGASLEATLPGSLRRAPTPADPPNSWSLAALLVVYCLLIVGASLFGGWLPALVDLTHDRMQIAMSLVGGLMLGIGLFHLLPHGVHELSSLDLGVWWTMIGLVTTFLLIRLFHFHQHGPVAHPLEGVHGGEAVVVPHVHGRELPHEHDHDHDSPGTAVSKAEQGTGHDHVHARPHELSWMGVFVGLSLHTLIDGVALAASVQADARHGHAGPLFGLGTFLAILLHKPLDAVSITTLMSAGGWSPGSRNLANVAYASMCPLGAIAFAIGIGRLGGAEHLLVGAALCFAAGVFVCIALGDILPEMEFHDHNKVVLTSMLLAGIGLAWAIGFVEPAHY